MKKQLNKSIVIVHLLDGCLTNVIVDNDHTHVFFIDEDDNAEEPVIAREYTPTVETHLDGLYSNENDKICRYIKKKLTRFLSKLKNEQPNTII